jgi:uncharacterized membrane protein YheB (UPF0754 family)
MFMHPALYTPLIPAFICWLLAKFIVRYLFKPLRPVKVLGMNFHGILPKYQNELAVSIAEMISSEILQDNFLKERLAHTDTLQRAMPVIEIHIDNFLNIKLKAESPAISIFVGEKIINQLKELFLKELEELFPSVMSQFIGDLSQKEELKQEMVVKLSGIQIDDIEAKFYRAFRNEINKIEFTFALGGLIAGVIQLIITSAVLK